MVSILVFDTGNQGSIPCRTYRPEQVFKLFNLPLMGGIDIGISLIVLKCDCPSWSKGSDLRPDMFRHAWVQIPHHAPHPFNSVGQSVSLMS